MIILTTTIPSKNVGGRTINGADYIKMSVSDVIREVGVLKSEFGNKDVVVVFDKNDTLSYAYREFRNIAHVEIN